jgi:C-methyltransferase
MALVALGVMAMKNSKHDEEALLVDWSTPPPLPIFIAVNAFAGALRSMANALTPPPIRMLDIGLMYHTTMLAYICQKFSIPDFLASGPKTVEEIAAYMQTEDVQRVERLMYALASEDMTQLDKTSPNRDAPRFVNTALSATLRSDHPHSVSGMIGHNVDDLWSVWGALPQMFGPDAVDNTWAVVWPNYSSIWDLYDADNFREEQFGRAMAALEGLGGKAMAMDGPFAKFQRMIDIGGSQGHFVHRVLSVNPSMKGVIFDRPHVIEHTKKLWNEPGGPYNDGTHERITMLAGSFFDASAIPEANDGDVYHLRYILHDWGDEDCLVILRNIKEKMKGKKATLLIGESAVPDRHSVGVPATKHHIDLQMMVVFGAIERTPKLWDKLLTQAGFEIVAIHPTRSLLHFVEAVPIQE